MIVGGEIGDGCTITTPEIRTMAVDSDVLITLSGNEAGLVLALGYVRDPEGQIIGMDLSSPAVLMSLPDDPRNARSHSNESLAAMLRAIADSIEARSSIQRVEDRGLFRPGSPE